MKTIINSKKVLGATRVGKSVSAKKMTTKKTSVVGSLKKPKRGASKRSSKASLLSVGRAKINSVSSSINKSARNSGAKKITPKPSSGKSIASNSKVRAKSVKSASATKRISKLSTAKTLTGKSPSKSPSKSAKKVVSTKTVAKKAGGIKAGNTRSRATKKTTSSPKFLLNGQDYYLRILCVMAAVAMLFILLVYRLFNLAYVDSAQLIDIQNQQIEVSREITPIRGDILDREGRPLAKDTSLVKVIIDPKMFHDDWCLFGSDKCLDLGDARDRKLQRERKTLEAVAQALNLEYRELRQMIEANTRRRYKVIALDLPPAYVEAHSKLVNLSPYLYLDYYHRRFYPMKEATSNLLGIVNHSGDGISGVEKAFNNYLKSENGKVLEKYSGKVGLRREGENIPQRHLFYTEEVNPARYGQSLQLSLDSYIQYSAYKHLAQDTLKFAAKESSVIVVDVTTGEVIALADYPGTNTNDRKNLKFDNTVSPSVSSLMEPGSSIKPLVMAGLLDAGKVKNMESIDTSPGYIRIDKWLVRDFKNYKSLTPGGIIQKSSNVGMVKLAKRLSGDEFSTFLSTLGLNESSGILPGLEVMGNLGNAWKSDVTKLNQSYGYGLEVSIVALARAYVALARYGNMIPLTLFQREDADDQGNKKMPPSQQVIQESSAASVLKWMELVTKKEGTGSKGAIPGVRVAAKTGTARARGFDKETNEVYNNIYAGIFPAENPKYLILVANKNIYPPYHYAGNSSAITFKAVATDLLNYYDNK